MVAETFLGLIAFLAGMVAGILSLALIGQFEDESSRSLWKGIILAGTFLGLTTLFMVFEPFYAPAHSLARAAMAVAMILFTVVFTMHLIRVSRR